MCIFILILTFFCFFWMGLDFTSVVVWMSGRGGLCVCVFLSLSLFFVSVCLVVERECEEENEKISERESVYLNQLYHFIISFITHPDALWLQPPDFTSSHSPWLTLDSFEALWGHSIQSEQRWIQGIMLFIIMQIIDRQRAIQVKWNKIRMK